MDSFLRSFLTSSSNASNIPAKDKIVCRKSKPLAERPARGVFWLCAYSRNADEDAALHRRFAHQGSLVERFCEASPRLGLVGVISRYKAVEMAHGRGNIRGEKRACLRINPGRGGQESRCGGRSR